MTVNLRKTEDVVKFIAITTTMNCDINVANGRRIVDGKSLMGLASMDLSKPVNVSVISGLENTYEEDLFKLKLTASGITVK